MTSSGKTELLIARVGVARLKTNEKSLVARTTFRVASIIALVIDLELL